MICKLILQKPCVTNNPSFATIKNGLINLKEKYRMSVIAVIFQNTALYMVDSRYS